MGSSNLKYVKNMLKNYHLSTQLKYMYRFGRLITTIHIKLKSDKFVV